MEIINHYLSTANKINSPNFSERTEDIDLVVIHCISLPEGCYENCHVEELFLNQLDTNKHHSFDSLEGIKVSAHLFIRRNGEVIQFVPFNKCAWHAGKSTFNGRENCNEFSIGIEMEGCISEQFEEVQYEILNNILALIKNNYGSISVVGHSDVAPERKLDPGENFIWDKVKNV